MSVDNYQSQKTDISESEIVAIPLFTSKSEPEPVAWIHDVVIDGKVRFQELKFDKVTNDKYAQNHRPLFASPPPMKRLSDEEIRAIGKDAFGIDLIFDGRLTEFAKAIEDALLEKNK